MDIQLPQRTLRRGLFGLCALVAGSGLPAALWIAARGLDRAPLAAFFSLSLEDNLPTWFSAVLLVSCASLLTLAALGAQQRRDPYRVHWWGLALGFAYMSLDEAVQIHERTNQWFDLHSIFYFGWVIPGLIVVASVGLCYLRFLAHLPAATRWDFVRAGVVYVGGALGVELVLGCWTDRYGADTLGYALIDFVEESMEIFGAALFICALGRYLAGAEGVLRIDFGRPAGRPETVVPHPARAVEGARLATRPGGQNPRDRVAGRAT